MRTYAQIDENNIVINIANFADDNTPTELGWPDWYEYSDDMRKNPASPGYTFIPEASGYPTGIFCVPCPHNTWGLDENYDWQPPADKPYPEGIGEEGNLWFWDDTIDEWDEKIPAPVPEPE